MTRAALLAFGAGSAGVLAAWEVLVAAEQARLPARVAALLAPLRRLGSDGREPSTADRRRLAIVAAAGLAVAGWLLAGVGLAVVAALAGPFSALAVVRARARRHRLAVHDGAAPAARALADALAAGHSVQGAVAVAASGVEGAAAGELRAAAHALAVGETTEATLERLRVRARSAAWDAIVAAVLLQRDAGGDLAGLLRRLAGSLEAAARAEHDARTATAQARFTARLVAAMPAGAAALAELADPGFVAGLLRHPVSGWLAAGAAILQVTGLVLIRRIAR